MPTSPSTSSAYFIYEPVLGLNNKGYELNCLKKKQNRNACLAVLERSGYQQSDMEVSAMLALSSIRSRAADDPSKPPCCLCR